MSDIELFDRVRIKSKDVIGFVVDINTDIEKYAVEKEGNEGPIFWGIEKSDIEKL